MPKVTIYHNPKCSKSRETLKLLEERGISPEVVLYLETPPTAATLKRLRKALGSTSFLDMMRQKEPEFAAAGLSEHATQAACLAALAKTPRLLERPIVVCGDKARIGRPPEAVLEVIE